jgi:hypothetical protein
MLGVVLARVRDGQVINRILDTIRLCNAPKMSQRRCSSAEATSSAESNDQCLQVCSLNAKQLNATMSSSWLKGVYFM